LTDFWIYIIVFIVTEWEVKVYYRALKRITVTADTKERAHNIAYNDFLDTRPDIILESSEIEDYIIETIIDGEKGSDMLHE
tara:strand:+ start:784 stop:1026 length:243 start_codon:yes stop_codon:yes gene_type:complete